MSVVELVKPKPVWTEAIIVGALSRETFKRKCVMLTNNCCWTGHECDVLGVTNDLRVLDIEVKISRADLKVDAKKDKWWHRTGWGVGMTSVQRDWPPKVWKHYYAIPKEIWRDDLAAFLGSSMSGVLLLSMSSSVHVSCERRAKPNPDAVKLTSEQVMNVARLQNLRMWEAFLQRDVAVRDYRELARQAA